MSLFVPQEDMKKPPLAAAIRLFDAAVLLDPSKAPHCWQRGLCLYYLGRYEEASLQFKCDFSVNGADVEELVWFAACRARLEGLDASRIQMPEPQGQIHHYESQVIHLIMKSNSESRNSGSTVIHLIMKL